MSAGLTVEQFDRIVQAATSAPVTLDTADRLMVPLESVLRSIAAHVDSHFVNVLVDRDGRHCRVRTTVQPRAAAPQPIEKPPAAKDAPPA